MMKIVHLKHASIQYTPEGCTTIFSDNTFCEAVPHETPHYFVIAHRCGYGDDIMAYCREHEVAHEIVAEWWHDKPSEVLWGLAHGQYAAPSIVAFEEVMAQTLQRWVRAHERPIVSGVDWDGLKAHTLKLLD